jgi:hypothetical protein
MHHITMQAITLAEILQIIFFSNIHTYWLGFHYNPLTMRSVNIKDQVKLTNILLLEFSNCGALPYPPLPPPPHHPQLIYGSSLEIIDL